MEDPSRRLVLLAGDWPNAQRWPIECPDWDLEETSPYQGDCTRAVSRLWPIWLLIGEVGGELAGRRLAEAALHIKHDLLVAVLGPRDDPDLCDRWAHHGARVYIDPSASPRRVVCFLETSQYLDALVIDEDLQRTALAQREQALAEVGGTLDLSEEEVRILRMLAMAATTHEIEDEFCMSQRTMERHLGVLFRKLAVRTRSEAVKRAHDLGV